MNKRMLRIAAAWAGFGLAAATQAADLPKPLVTGLKNPESVCLGPDGKAYVTEIGEFGKDGDGLVSVVADGKATPFATGLDDPKGIVAYQGAFYVTDKTRVVKIDAQGKVSTFVAPDKFPAAPLFLNDIAIEAEGGQLFVSDSGDLMGAKGAVYKIDVKTAKTSTVVDSQSLPTLKTPNGLILDGASSLLMVDFASGDLYRIALVDNSAKKIGSGFEGGDGLTWDHHGRLFITSWKQGKVWGIARPGEKAVLMADKFEQAADSCLAKSGRELLVPDMKGGTLTALPTQIAGWEVDDSPLPLGTEVAFGNVEFTGWSPSSEDGLPTPLRPILLTHFGDGSNRVVVPTQQGVIHFFKNSDEAQKTSIFMDIRDRVRYLDKQNEEGLLGLAFHPQFKKNGEFFVFYTDVKSEMANVVSRFRTMKDDPNRGDPKSEEVLLRFEKPFWNHDGGTIAFGPDGCLYVVHGDGGKANDPYENGQNLKNLLGKILRIDVDRKENGKPYAIPKDNPFVGKADAAPEIWAYGFRNPWRMAFDRQSGQLWVGEVGQNLWEEINLAKAGGNFGWNLRESQHPFGAKGVDVRPDLIEPIWEYHHDVGKSITGGTVYRGKKTPALSGAYVYADYVSMRHWALWYDAKAGRVVANREIAGPGLPVLSYGEDEQGEVYFLVAAPNGKGIHRYVDKPAK